MRCDPLNSVHHLMFVCEILLSFDLCESRDLCSELLELPEPDVRPYCTCLSVLSSFDFVELFWHK